MFCLSGSDGTELWNFTGMPERASILTNASPAVDGDTVVIPYPTGDLVALRASGGQALWQELLARSAGGSSLGAMSDAARPVIYGGVVYAVGHGGRMIATTQKTGERVWSLSVASIEQPWVAGDSVFVVDTTGQLIAITRNDGKMRWSTKLGTGTWAGPVLAGNRLWLTSVQGPADERRANHRQGGRQRQPGLHRIYRARGGWRPPVCADRRRPAAGFQLSFACNPR